MKTKKYFKRVIAGLLAFAVVLTCGSFGNVKSVKAEGVPSAWYVDLNICIPTNYGDLNPKASGMFSASSSIFNYKVEVVPNTNYIDVKMLSKYTYEDDNSNMYTGFKLRVTAINGNPNYTQNMVKAFSSIMKDLYFNNTLYYQAGSERVDMFTPKAGYSLNGVVETPEVLSLLNDFRTISRGTVLNVTSNVKGSTYKVQFIDGSSVVDSMTLTYGQSGRCPSTVPTKTGYTFLGWSTSASATTAKYVAGQSFSNLTTTAGATVKLYAIWAEKTYKSVATIKDMCGSKVLGMNTYTIVSNRKFTSSATCVGQSAGTKNGSYPGYKLVSYGKGSFPANSETTSVTIVNQWEECNHKGSLSYTPNVRDGEHHGIKCSVCGYSESDIACDFELKDSTKATCTEDSTEHLTCKYCGLTKTTHNTKATGHSYTLMDVKADALYQPATCATAPKYYYSCANCGKVEGDANHVFSNGDTLGHDYQTVYENNNGIHNGKESKVCSRCHDEKDVKYLLYIDPLDAIKNDVAFTSGFGYYSKGQQVQVQGLANVNKTIGYGTPYYVYNDKKLDISTGIITMPDHAISVSLTADLEIYNLNFVVSHGWMTVPTQNFKYGEGVSTLAMPAMDTGYQFLGWYDNEDCTGEPVTSIAATEHADKTLYGKTEVITYNIDYEFGGAKGIGIDSIKVDDSVVKSYNIESDSIKLPTAEDIEVVGDVANDKVEFKGWYSNKDMTEPVTEIQTGSIGNKIVYAKYSMKAAAPTIEPTETPSATPSTKPSQTPSGTPTVKPSQMPSSTPTVKPSQIPSAKPSASPSTEPFATPSVTPSVEPTNTPSVVPTTVPTTKPNQSFVTSKPVVNTTVVTKGGITYKVKGKSCVVTKSNKKIKKAVVQKKVKFVINGKTVTYKVTGIEKNVFKNCKKLKSLTIKSTTIKKIAKNAFKGVSKKCKVKVPKKQFKKYRKLLKKAKFKGKIRK